MENREKIYAIIEELKKLQEETKLEIKLAIQNEYIYLSNHNSIIDKYFPAKKETA